MVRMCGFPRIEEACLNEMGQVREARRYEDADFKDGAVRPVTDTGDFDGCVAALAGLREAADASIGIGAVPGTTAALVYAGGAAGARGSNSGPVPLALAPAGPGRPPAARRRAWRQLIRVRTRTRRAPTNRT